MADPRWGSENREVKAEAIIKTVLTLYREDMSKSKWADLGCGSGGIASHIAPYVGSMTAIDPEPWEKWGELAGTHQNLSFLVESIDKLSCDDNQFDVVICNQVYEHVEDKSLLLNEIYRILKEGGCCYFAGPNLLFPIEPHVFLPFVHWLPRRIAERIVSWVYPQKVLDAFSMNYWQLIELFKRFRAVEDVVPFMIKNPELYGKRSVIWKTLSYVPFVVTEKLAWLSPGFVFLLRK